jgi:hypothetical protein
MSATPITPGRSYRVKGCGFDLIVLAKHPVDALLIVMEMM